MQNEQKSAPLLEAVNLTKRYEDGVLALDHCNFVVRPGEISKVLVAPSGSAIACLRPSTYRRAPARQARRRGVR